MKVVLTGGSGFIGSNLAQKCLDLGWEVICIDNLSTGNIQNTSDHLGNKNFKFIKDDVLNTENLIKIFIGSDILFHMSALARVQYSTDFPIESNTANISGTLSVLEAARKTGIKRVVYSASSSMFGGQDIPFPTPETTAAHPRSNYALQKYVGLEYCRLYSELYGLDTCSLIYFNVYGPGQRLGGAYSTVIPAFFDAAINNRACRIDGSGVQSRDFCYVDNVVDANILAATYGNKIAGECFNIACGETHSVNEIFYKIQSLSGRPLEKIMAPVRAGDPIKSLADISKAKRVLGYEPKVYMDEGLEKTHKWCLLNYK